MTVDVYGKMLSTVDDDRYQLITLSVQLCGLGGAWVVSVLLWTPWIVAWPYIEGRRTVPTDD